LSFAWQPHRMAPLHASVQLSVAELQSGKLFPQAV
jgi:hypothetical protein